MKVKGSLDHGRTFLARACMDLEAVVGTASFLNLEELHQLRTSDRTARKGCEVSLKLWFENWFSRQQKQLWSASIRQGDLKFNIFKVRGLATDRELTFQ